MGKMKTAWRRDEWFITQTTVNSYLTLDKVILIFAFIL